MWRLAGALTLATVLLSTTVMYQESAAEARQVTLSPTLGVDVPEVYTISTLGGCDEHTVSVFESTGGTLPLRTSAIVSIQDRTGYQLSVAFLPSVDVSGIRTIEGVLSLCLPAPVEVVEPFSINVTVFSTGCANIANNCSTRQQISVVRQAPIAPDPPVNVTAIAGDATARVSWTTPSRDGGAPVSGYQVNANPGTHTCQSRTASCTITGLTNGTAYTFTVTATNSAGTSLPSAPSAPVVPTQSISKPSKVVDLAAKPQKRRIIVTWSPPANLGGAESVSYQYRINKKKWVNTDRTRIVVRGKPGRKITVRVRAVNEAGFGQVARVSGRVR